MRTTLVDTGPLVALAEPVDRHHAWAQRQFDALKGPLLVAPAVLVEAHFLLPAPHQRARLHWLLQNEFVVGAPANEAVICDRALSWLTKYSDHSPDFTDAFLIAWHEAEKTSRIWTMDAEFVNVWRTSRGKRPLLAASPPHATQRR